MDKRTINNGASVLAVILILFNCFETINCQFDCTGKPNGDYPDPVDQCSGYFYTCSNGEASYIVCAQTGTVFDPKLGRCEYCELVYPCNADPNNIRCATLLTSSTPAKPTCPPYDPNVYTCICSANSCQLELITTTTTPKPTCPPYDPNVYTCICDATACILELITTTTTPKPTCPPYDPNVYICVCDAISCSLQLITTTTTPKPTCPPYDPNVYICVCSDITCTLELITTTTSPTSAVTDPCPGTTRGTTISNFEFDCSSKPNGDYADPFNPCSGYFWSCTNGDAFYKKCALQGTVFDAKTIKCDYCANVSPCNVAF